MVKSPKIRINPVFISLFEFFKYRIIWFINKGIAIYAKRETIENNIDKASGPKEF